MAAASAAEVAFRRLRPIAYAPPAMGRGFFMRRATARVLLLAALAAFGCGSTRQRTASDQLLMSSAVDDAIAEIDFTPLTGQTVFFDTQYIRDSRSSKHEVGDAQAGYVISSLRQQMAAAGCLLAESAENADFVVEGRVGAMGRDESEVIYGVPANNLLGAAATAAATVSAVPQVPTIPEIALAKRDNRRAAAKVALFAYHRASRQIVWQSGQSQAETTAEDRWVLGAGPFQKGTIYDGVRLAGSRIGPLHDQPDMTMRIAETDEPHVFVRPSDLIAALDGGEPDSSDDGAAESRVAEVAVPPTDAGVIQAGHSVAEPNTATSHPSPDVDQNR